MVTLGRPVFQPVCAIVYRLSEVYVHCLNHLQVFELLTFRTSFAIDFRWIRLVVGRICWRDIFCIRSRLGQERQRGEFFRILDLLVVSPSPLCFPKRRLIYLRLNVFLSSDAFDCEFVAWSETIGFVGRSILRTLGVSLLAISIITFVSFRFLNRFWTDHSRMCQIETSGQCLSRRLHLLTHNGSCYLMSFRWTERNPFYRQFFQNDYPCRLGLWVSLHRSVAWLFQLDSIEFP